jgi:hypothetical protein
MIREEIMKVVFLRKPHSLQNKPLEMAAHLCHRRVLANGCRLRYMTIKELALCVIFPGIGAHRDVVALSKLSSQSRLKRAFNANMKLDLGKRGINEESVRQFGINYPDIISKKKKKEKKKKKKKKHTQPVQYELFDLSPVARVIFIGQPFFLDLCSRLSLG